MPLIATKMKHKLALQGIASVFLFICLNESLFAIYTEPQMYYKRHFLTLSSVAKASFTQRGYIQFLKYVVNAPEMTDYTFCIWLQSNNLTHNHPLLSYSKHEKQRLIRVWLSSLGSHINFELLGIMIFSIPVHAIENQWYHFCQSWSSIHGGWSLYFNRKLLASGFEPKLKNKVIPSGGDMVVGQEYTDFDKGLDDGIEGNISGFNLVLASTFSPHLNYHSNRLLKHEILKKPSSMNGKYFHKVVNSSPEKLLSRRQLWDESLQFMHKFITPLPLEKSSEILYHSKKSSYDSPLYHNIPLENNNRVSLNQFIQKPLGLLLVELSYDCSYLRGAPLSGKGVLISWTKTPVRVFGGAILKTVAPFCGKMN